MVRELTLKRVLTRALVQVEKFAGGVDGTADKAVDTRQNAQAPDRTLVYIQALLEAEVVGGNGLREGVV